MLFSRLKNFISVALAIAFALLIAVGVKTANVSRLSALEGDRVFFLDSASSQGLMKTELTLVELGRVKGECVSFSLNDYDGGRYALSEDIALAIVEEFDAEIVTVETLADVTSYYCYTPRWGDAIALQGQPINLHVAISKEQCVVGTPIIFGGF